jgi:UDP-N-acetylmuramoyl-L-alanyl-D-glutamate--2,6-diaminopimelate ligase
LAQIFEDMRDGVSEPEKMTWMTDRRRAIGLALAMAKPGDTVLIAGKGDESFQECADTVYPFDDREVARELLRAQGALRKT